MAVSFNTSSSTSLSPPSLSCATKLFVGLKPQSSCSFTSARPNLTADFYDRVSKSLQSSGGRPTRGRVNMAPIGTPRVPYRVPGEGTWQWVDLWNALFFDRILMLVKGTINRQIFSCPLLRSTGPCKCHFMDVHYSLAFDAVYTPKMTRLLKEAEQEDAIIVNGLEMFIGQAYEQYERFTGLPAPKELFRKILA